jgi:hypothetical protein
MRKSVKSVRKSMKIRARGRARERAAKLAVHFTTPFV